MNLLSLRLRPARVAVATFAVALAGFLWLYSRSPVISDTDSYYHLTVARAQAEEGLHHDFPWARFGLFSRGYGDKEVLFHALIAPFVAVLGADPGGRVALATFDAAVLAAIAWVAAHALGWWGVLVPAWLWLAAGGFAWRLVRLRPEVLSLLLLLVALWAVAQRRYRLVGVLAAVYALAYVAIHAFVGLCFLLFLATGLSERRWDWRLLLYPTLGAGVGLLVHPQFPHNLTIVWFCAVDFFRLKGVLDVGGEVKAQATDIVLKANFAWWLSLPAAWYTSAPVDDSAAAEESRRPAMCFGVAAAVFGLLYLLMARFSVYFVTFFSLWLIFELSRRGRRLGGRLRLGGGHSLPFWAVAGVCLLVALPFARFELGRYLQMVDPGPNNVAVQEMQEWAQQVPPGARAAAPWGASAVYMYYAPWGRYLSMLDPGLLAYSDPEIHNVQWRVFTGAEPDVPLRVVSDLESEYLAYPLPGSAALTARLEADPRVAVAYRGVHSLFRICLRCNERFVLDWRVKAGRGKADDSEGWVEYPRRTDAARSVEGFVDASRVVDRVVGKPLCATFSRTESVDEAESRLYEWAPYGPARFTLDGQSLVETGASLEAVLGHGIVVPVDLEPGEHWFAVSTCVSAPGSPAGFYLLRHR